MEYALLTSNVHTEQYGFRKGRLTEDVHFILEAEAQEAFKQNLILVSLDLEKAYHTC
jgi:hypothetical protein